MSRRAVIYCSGNSAHEERTTMDQLRTVARKHGWTVVKVVHRPEVGGTQPATLTQMLAKSEADLLIVPSFAAMADTVQDALEGIARLRDSGCDLYVHDTELDTTSPIDRVLFRIADGLRSIEKARAKPATADHARRTQTKKLEPTPFQRSVINGALKSGMKPREVAKSSEAAGGHRPSRGRRRVASSPPMLAIGGKAEVLCQWVSGPFIAKTRHSSPRFNSLSRSCKLCVLPHPS